MLQENGYHYFAHVSQTQRGKKYAQQYKLPSLTGNLIEICAEYDVIISAESLGFPLLDSKECQKILKMRKFNPMMILDFGNPPDWPHLLQESNGFYYYHYEMLEEKCQQGLHVRNAYKKEAEVKINQYCQEYLLQETEKKSIPVITLYRQFIAKESEYLLKQYPNMNTETALHKLSQRLLHHPTIALKKEARQGKKELQSALLELFPLDNKE